MYSLWAIGLLTDWMKVKLRAEQRHPGQASFYAASISRREFLFLGRNDLPSTDWQAAMFPTVLHAGQDGEPSGSPQF